MPGYASSNVMFKLSEGLRRAPLNPWFALIGAYERNNQTQFEIGTKREVTAVRSGRLTCYANDLPLMYWNNSGSVTLRVTRAS